MNAPADQNYVRSKLACLNTDTVQGTNLVPIAINTSNGGIEIDDAATISFTMKPVTPEDGNYVDCWLFQGSNDLLYPAVATASGALLIDF